MNKEELSDMLNELLQVQLDFSKMAKEDLEKLVTVLGEPTYLIQLGARNLRPKAKKELIDWLTEMINKDWFETGKSEGGPLGLGVLPRIFKRIAPREQQQKD